MCGSRANRGTSDTTKRGSECLVIGLRLGLPSRAHDHASALPWRVGYPCNPGGVGPAEPRQCICIALPAPLDHARACDAPPEGAIRKILAHLGATVHVPRGEWEEGLMECGTRFGAATYSPMTMLQSIHLPGVGWRPSSCTRGSYTTGLDGRYRA
jgi:hypothetical protein